MVLMTVLLLAATCTEDYRWSLLPKIAEKVSKDGPRPCYSRNVINGLSSEQIDEGQVFLTSRFKPETLYPDYSRKRRKGPSHY